MNAHNSNIENAKMIEIEQYENKCYLFQRSFKFLISYDALWFLPSKLVYLNHI